MSIHDLFVAFIKYPFTGEDYFYMAVVAVGVLILYSSLTSK